MIAIGDIQLSDNLTLPGIKNIQKRIGSTRYTIGGRAVVQSVAINAGQQITLVSKEPLGDLTGQQVDAINALKASGETIQFVHHTGTWQVIVTEVAVSQGVEYSDPNQTDTYYGIITMQII